MVSDKDILTKTSAIDLSESCEILLKAATPDIYRKNAFRISGLPVSAGTKEITSQIRKIQMLEKYGNKSIKRESPFILEPPPDDDLIRQALHRLRDPETRLIDEFFWFWPHDIDPGKKDNALDALAKGDIKSAESIWINDEVFPTVSNVSRHNLAVLSHLQALDLELKGNGIDECEISKRDEFWEDTFKRWKVLLCHEGFWSLLEARVKQIDDPMMTITLVSELRESLPPALLMVNAMLALQAVERKDTETARRHLLLIHNSGFGREVAEAAIKEILKPVRNRIKILTKSFAEKTYSDHEDELKDSRKLIDQAKDLLRILDIMLPATDSLREVAHDEVALEAMHLAVSYSNVKEDYENTAKIYEQLAGIVIGESAKQKVNSNYEITKKNIEYDRLHNTCFFCEKNKANKTSGIKISMYGNIRKVRKDVFGREIPHDYGDSVPYGEEVYTKWSSNTVEVPRCNACKQEHELYEKTSKDAKNAKQKITKINKAIVRFISYLISPTKSKIKVPEVHTLTTKEYSYHLQFPRIKELQKEGWQFGEKPPGVY